MNIYPFQYEHVQGLVQRDTTGHLQRWVDEGYLEQAQLSAVAYTAINNHGEVTAIGGIMEYWHGRAEAWGMLRTNTPSEFLAVHRAALRMMKQYQGRIELVVDCDFPEGQRWASALGFKLETPLMPGYLPEGRGDASMYVRITRAH